MRHPEKKSRCKVILVGDVQELGKRGQVVQVAKGYGRNYLIPKQLAMPVTPGNLKMVEQQRLVAVKREVKYKEEAQLLVQELDRLHLVFSRKAGETGLLFGSVTAKDVGDLLAQQGIRLDRRKILLELPIKKIGNFNVPVHPHTEVHSELLVSVTEEKEETVTRVLTKNEESQQIVQELENVLQQAEKLADAQKPQEPEATSGEQPQNEEKEPTQETG